MNVQQEQTKQKSILDDLAVARAEIRGQASGKPVEDVLPEGNVQEEDPVAEQGSVEAVSASEEVQQEAAAKPEIRIGDKVFKSEAEAIKYAESLEQDKLLAESYNMGIKEALALVQKPQEAEPVVEENFEETFYANPKEALTKMKEQAKQEVIGIMKAERAEEEAWHDFSNKYPDLADSRSEVNRIMQENWDVLSKIKDKQKAMDLLAIKTRSYFDQIVEKRKPRTELPNKPGPAVSTGSQHGPSVTPKQKSQEPLTLAQQLKSMRMRK